jgi:hypothetical protein
MPSKTDFFHYVGERLRSPEVTDFGRERALLANTELVEVVRQIDLEFNCPGDKGDVAQGNVQALSCFAFTASLQPTSSEYSKIGCGRPIR